MIAAALERCAASVELSQRAYSIVVQEAVNFSPEGIFIHAMLHSTRIEMLEAAWWLKKRRTEIQYIFTKICVDGSGWICKRAASYCDRMMYAQAQMMYAQTAASCADSSTKIFNKE